MDDLSVWALAGICMLACCLVMACAWLWAHKIKNASVVDMFWSYNFPLIAVIIFFLAPGWETRRLLMCLMVILAGARLGTHLATRILSHLDEEEGRYQQLRKEWSPNAERTFFFFFQFQAISNVILAIPFIVVVMNTTVGLSPFEWVGFIIWAISVIGETIADRQLAAFKKDPANKGQVCSIGLWNYSRHPNYFFEWLMWMAYFIFALGSPYGWLGIISPAIILYLLLKVTGIPATEEQSLRSKGDAFRAYQKSTSVFVPWFKRS
jgi:steroid 5-alpha reductase family enzyme